MSDTTTLADMLSGDKPSAIFQENSVPIVKPNSLPLNEINLPSFRDVSPPSTSPNNPPTEDCATSTTFYHDLCDKFGNIALNDYQSDVHLQRLQKQVLLRHSNETVDFPSSSMKTKISSPEEMRGFVDHQQNHSPYKAVPTTNPLLQLESSFYDQQQTLRSLLADRIPFGENCQQYQPPFTILTPYSNYSAHESIQHDLNSLSQFLGSRNHPGEDSLPHLSPNKEELKPFIKQPDGELPGNFGSSFFNAAGENENLKMVSPLKIPEFPETAINNFATGSQFSDALMNKLRQQNSLPAKQQPAPMINMMEYHQYGISKKDLLARQLTLSNLTSLDQERFTKLYLNDLLKENPNLLSNHLLASLPMSSLPFPFSFHNSHVESYSRKVFVGGLPPDSDEDEITASFRQFGPLIVDWPHKAETKTNFPPKGYCFLLFQDEMSVQNLMEACVQGDGKFYWCITCSSQKEKPVRRVQIRPWCLIDSDFVLDGTQPLDLRKTIFVGGVPRPLRAVELALAMERLYGGVCYAGIDTDPELKYPKGAGRVSFSNQQSYIAAISARFVQLQFGDIDKRVEVKPYVLDDQLCDECQGQKCAGKSAPYFCANVACLQYYCEICWVQIHSRPGREFHKPLVKEGADRPKSIPPFKW